MGLLYFVPGAKAITAELLDAHGLTRLIDRPQSRETYADLAARLAC